MTIDNLTEAISRLQNKKSPGNDLITGYWYKNLVLWKRVI